MNEFGRQHVRLGDNFDQKSARKLEKREIHVLRVPPDFHERLDKIRCELGKITAELKKRP